MNENNNAGGKNRGTKENGVLYRAVSLILPPTLLMRIKSLKKSQKTPSGEPEVDYSKKNVMVGMLRNPRQLNKNLKGNFYHIPAKLLKNNYNEIKYVAIYQSKTLFGKIGGIRYYGKVESIVPKKRRDITEIPSASEEIYDYIRIKEWKLLKKAVKAKECRGPVFFTTEYLLKTASTTSELLFGSEKEHALFKLLASLFSEGSENESVSSGNVALTKHDGVVEVTENGAFLTSVNSDDFDMKPYETTHELFLMIS